MQAASQLEIETGKINILIKRGVHIIIHVLVVHRVSNRVLF